MAASAAATVRMKSENTWPVRSPRNDEKATRLMLTESRISSTDIRMTMMFLRLRMMPATPSVNSMAATIRYWFSPTAMIRSSHAGPRGHFLELDVRLVARVLVGDDLALDVGLVAQRQHDRADHGGEQDEARRLEEVDVLRVEHEAEGVRVGHAFGERRPCPGDRRGSLRPGADDEHELDQHRGADQRADRQVLQEALLQLREVDVEHHDHEEEQHRDGADVDDDDDHRQELGAEQQEQAGRVDEGQDE